MRLSETCDDHLEYQNNTSRKGWLLSIHAGIVKIILWFCKALRPLTSNRQNKGYILPQTETQLYHLCWMDDLKLYARNWKYLSDLLSCVITFRSEIQKKFGLDNAMQNQLNGKRKSGLSIRNLKLVGTRKRLQQCRRMTSISTSDTCKLEVLIIWQLRKKSRLHKAIILEDKKAPPLKLNNKNLNPHLDISSLEQRLINWKSHNMKDRYREIIDSNWMNTEASTAYLRSGNLFRGFYN